jgi:hypothetical protein
LSVEVFHYLYKMLEGTTQTIKPPYYQGVTRAELFKGLVKTRA